MALVTGLIGIRVPDSAGGADAVGAADDNPGTVTWIRGAVGSAAVLAEVGTAAEEAGTSD